MKIETSLSTKKEQGSVLSLWLDIFFLVLALWCLFYIIPEGISIKENQQGITARSLPVISMIVVGICSVSLLFYTAFQRKTTRVYFHKGYLNNTLSSILCFGIYILSIEFIGFLLSSFLALIGLLIIIGNKSPFRILLTTLCVIATLYGLLHYGLGVVFPSGKLLE